MLRLVPTEIVELEEAERVWRLTRLIEPIFFGRLQRVQRELLNKVNGLTTSSASSASEKIMEAPAQIGRIAKLWQRVDDFTIGISETMGKIYLVLRNKVGNSIDVVSFFVKKIAEPFGYRGTAIGTYSVGSRVEKEDKKEDLSTRDIGKHYGKF